MEFVAAANYPDVKPKYCSCRARTIVLPGVSKRGAILPIAILIIAEAVTHCLDARAETAAVELDSSGRLAYRGDERGNVIPDFSHCGYAGGNRDIPEVPARISVVPGEGDDGAAIQAAIDRLAQDRAGASGFRGAVLLGPGQFEIAGQLTISASGIVLRGSGAGHGGTKLLATGQSRRALVRVRGIGDRQAQMNEPFRVADSYVPVGSRKLRLESTKGLNVGDQVQITRPSTEEWIDASGMDAFGVAWKPGTRNLIWDRTIVAMDDATITLDAPTTAAIESVFGGATVESYEWPGRLSNVGIENLQMASEYDDSNPRDEEHAWFGITMEHAQNSWVRCAEFRHFAGGAVALSETSKFITVEDCIALEPVSEPGGYRRHTFCTRGQLNLFLRCWSERGRNDFAAGHCAAGPNAFVNCYAADAIGASGPMESWACGVLYDNVRVDGGSLDLDNRWNTPPGAGWSAANCVLWQCQAAAMRVFRPPTANNWAIGVWGDVVGDGTIQARSDFVRPMSLYQAQLRDRLGAIAAKRISPGLMEPIGATNPSVSEAATFAAQSAQSPLQLIDVIRESMATSLRSSDQHLTEDIAVPVKQSVAPDAAAPGLRIKNGRLVTGDRLVTGGLIQQQFWRGTIRPDEAATFGPAITRFVPGLSGTGFTDDLEQVADAMQADGIAVFDHHYGLWYDRRRDDHTMVRRQDDNVAPPFYEQPFARTGRGKAWDGLSKYDLTKFNPWYWNRLREFAQLCESRGLVLFHENYFQHNVLEAGAHWADCPWRPANNVNDTGFAEPPPYIGDKRIFIASQFYDVTHPQRRELHRGYIRQCLDNFAGCSNVVQLTSAEYSGPLEFVQFWLDTVIAWEKEHDRDVLVALSAPKDVQDAILNDPRRGPFVDIIDIRYWAYAADGDLYAPEGGQHLSPRQHLRQTKQKSGGFAAIVKAVREYRDRFPEKAVTYYADMHCPSSRDGWAVLIGGGSLPNVKLPEKLARDVVSMGPADDIVEGNGVWQLANRGGDCLAYIEKPGTTLQVNSRIAAARYRLHWIDGGTNEELAADTVTIAQPTQLTAKASVLWLERVATD
jgi:hypothetical protein